MSMITMLQQNVQNQNFDYANLPLASIPESKESMLEDQSNLANTFYFKNRKSISNANSMIESEMKDNQ